MTQSALHFKRCLYYSVVYAGGTEHGETREGVATRLQIRDAACWRRAVPGVVRRDSIWDLFSQWGRWDCAWDMKKEIRITQILALNGYHNEVPETQETLREASLRREDRSLISGIFKKPIR